MPPMRSHSRPTRRMPNVKVKIRIQNEPVWVPRIVDKSLLPEKYITVGGRVSNRLNSYASEMKEKAICPGVEFYNINIGPLGNERGNDYERWLFANRGRIFEARKIAPHFYMEVQLANGDWYMVGSAHVEEIIPAETQGHTLTPSEGGDTTFEGKPPAPRRQARPDADRGSATDCRRHRSAARVTRD
jgi:hypothetical protein